MSAIKPGIASRVVIYWLPALILALTLKQFYSAASAALLQWQLYPLVVALELLTELRFEQCADSGWFDALHQVSIVKPCAGINFLIISLLGYWWLWRDKPLRSYRIVLAFGLAWLTALSANVLRIVLCLYGQLPLAALIGFAEADAHRLIGIAVYFLTLWLQLARFNRKNLHPAATVAAAMYLSEAVFMPMTRAWLLGLEQPGWNYLVWAIGMPVAIAASVQLARVFRGNGGIGVFRYRLLQAKETNRYGPKQLDSVLSDKTLLL
ncbi:MAG: exosortase K [Methylobacter sp.]